MFHNESLITEFRALCRALFNIKSYNQSYQNGPSEERKIPWRAKEYSKGKKKNKQANSGKRGKTKAWESAGDQGAIGVGFASDWLRQ